MRPIFSHDVVPFDRKKNPNLIFDIHYPRKRFISYKNYLIKISGWVVDQTNRSVPQVRVRIGKSFFFYPWRRKRHDIAQLDRVLGETTSACPGFEFAIVVPVGIYFFYIEIEESPGNWVSIYKTILVKLPFFNKEAGPRLSYDQWLRLEDKEMDFARSQTRKNIITSCLTTKFLVIIDARAHCEDLDKTIKSCNEQWYEGKTVLILASAKTAPHISVITPTRCVLTDNVAYDLANDPDLKELAQDFIVLMRCGDRLHPRILYEFASILAKQPNLDLIYSDEDCLDDHNNRINPFYKPDWSPDYLESLNYIGHAACVRSQIFRDYFHDHYYDFLLRLCERNYKIHHTATVLYHAKPPAAEHVRQLQQADAHALQARMARTSRTGDVVVLDQDPHSINRSAYLLKLTLSSTPLVSIIIPTNGCKIDRGGGQIDLLTNCLSSLKKYTNYQNYEVIIVENGNLSPQIMAELTKFSCKFVHYGDRVFSFSKKINLGAKAAQGSLLLMLNDDIEIIEPDWLFKMVSHFEKPHVGVVGAKLLYPDDSVQHVGVVHIHGQPFHIDRFADSAMPGYFHSRHVPRNYLAVTGACLMTKAKLFAEVGALTQELAVEYNDIDYCLKIDERGYSIVCAGDIVLRHLESQSRARTTNPSERAYFLSKWQNRTKNDRFFNENAFSPMGNFDLAPDLRRAPTHALKPL